MIDLSKNQIVEDDVKVWVWSATSIYHTMHLIAINHKLKRPYICTPLLGVEDTIYHFANCSLTDPRGVEFPKIRCKKDLKELDVDVWGVAWLDNENIREPTSWDYNRHSEEYFVCHRATGQTMQVESELPYELPKEPKMRYMTRDEILHDIAHGVYKGCVVRFLEHNWYVPESHNFIGNIKNYEWCKITKENGKIVFGEPQKFMVEDV